MSLHPAPLVAPRAGNESVLGLDVGTQPGNLAALLQSRDTDVVGRSAPGNRR